MKRNVLQLIGTFEIGGTECQAVQLSRLIKQEATYNVFIGCLDAAGPLRAEAELYSSEKIPEFRLNSFYDVNFWSQIRRCIAYIKEQEIGIIQTHDFYTNIFGMLAGFLAGVPVRIASKRNTFSKTRNQMMVERQAFRAADRIVVNGEAVRASLVAKGVSDGKIVQVYNGIDIDRFEPEPGVSKLDQSRELGLETLADNKVVTIVANLRSDVKNHKMFLRTAHRIKAEFDKVSFVIAGEGELVDPLKAEAAALGIAKSTYFIGRCDNIPALLSISDICMLTSRSEGFPNSILEYMAAGKPVVASSVGGVPEIVADGRTGYLIPSDDDAMASKRVLTLLRDADLAYRFGARAKAIVSERYSLSAQLDQVLGLYDSLLTLKRRITAREPV